MATVASRSGDLIPERLLEHPLVPCVLIAAGVGPANVHRIASEVAVRTALALRSAAVRARAK